MSNFSKIFGDAKVKINNKSAFDMSHITQGTLTTGTLVPALCEPLLPGDKVSLGALSEINFAPFASQPYGKIDFCSEAFFVPYRILWGGWQNFITMPVNNPFAPDLVRPRVLPSISSIILENFSDVEDAVSRFGRGSLLDYLGVNGAIDPYAVDGEFSPTFNALPFLAYHKVYDDWYRNPNLQKPVFSRVKSSPDVAKNLPWYPDSHVFSYQIDNTGDGVALSISDSAKFGDGSDILQLRQRNWGKDYFTTCQLFPQANGDVVGAGIQIPEGSTTLTISQIRQANVLQKWLERNNVAGTRYADQIQATFGIRPSDAILDRPLFLGSTRTPVYTKGVKVTSGNSSQSNNPFSSQAGSTAGSALGVSQSSLVGDFTATEYGFIMVLISVVPHAQYSSGTRRYLMESKVSDIPNPLLQGLGEQAVFESELCSVLSQGTFGYQPQYSHYKYHNDEVHGLLLDGENLESFCIQRSFDTSVKLGTDFLTIPKNALDQITAVDSNVSRFIAWYNIGFEFKKISSLSEYVIPTLGEVPNTHTETIPNRGTSL